MSFCFYLDWHQRQDSSDYYVAANSLLPAQQNSSGTIKNITSADFPNRPPVLLDIAPEHMYLRQKYTDMLKQGLTEELTKAIDAQIITPQFKSLDNQSALAIAFLNQQYEVFVWLKSKGFREFAWEGPFEINTLSNAAKYRVKVAMQKLKQYRNNGVNLCGKDVLCY